MIVSAGPRENANMSAQKITVAILLVSLMLQTGLEVNLANVVAALKDYRSLGRAFLANFIIVPVLAVVLVKLFQLNDFIAIGILLMAIAPGVPFLPFSGGRKKGGSLGFALCLAFLMPLISLVTVPITASLVLPRGEVADFPISSLLINIICFQLLPLVAGAVIAERAPQVADKLLRPVALVFILALVVVLAALLPDIVKSIGTVYGSRGIITALLLIVLSTLTGWLLGGADIKYRRTLAIGTTLRNVGLALLITSANFPDRRVAAMVMSYFIIQVIVAAAAGKMFSRAGESGTPAAVSG